MKRMIAVTSSMIAYALFAVAVAVAGGGQSKAALPKGLSGLAGPFDLAGPLKPEVRYYVQKTDLVYLGFDGKRTGTASFTVKLRLVPAALSGKDGDEFTVREVVLKSGDGEPETIPELAGWSYIFQDAAGGIDEAGQVFGIPHAKFLGLKTNRGRTLGTIEDYFIYNSFIDFHAFADVFARPTEGGGGIQDLKTIGQSIRHAAAFSEPPVNLGEAIKKGSVFRNGDVRMSFNGLRRRRLRFGREHPEDDRAHGPRQGRRHGGRLGVHRRHLCRPGDALGEEGDAGRIRRHGDAGAGDGRGGRGGGPGPEVPVLHGPPLDHEACQQGRIREIGAPERRGRGGGEAPLSEVSEPEPPSVTTSLSGPMGTIIFRVLSPES